MVTKFPIRWDTHAFLELQSIADYLQVISPQASKKVVSSILKATKLIATKPRMYLID